jgi:hypothetical protein
MPAKYVGILQEASKLRKATLHECWSEELPGEERASSLLRDYGKPGNPRVREQNVIETQES